MSPSIEHLESYRPALTGHCYRMLGSVTEAEDAVQETLLRAWRGLSRFDGRASVRTWLYRIATNVCLDELSDRTRRARPMEESSAGPVDGPLVTRPRGHWLEPIPDVEALPTDANPAELAVLRQSIRLAFVAALQKLPPKQRAVLLLIDVLGWSPMEVAESLELSIGAVNSALQRARGTVDSRAMASPDPMTDVQRRLLDRYVNAFQRYDIDELASLLHEDAVFSMPPYELWLQGPEPVRAWLKGRGSICRGSVLVPCAACGSPAFGQYHPSPEGGLKPWAVIVLELSEDRITGWNSFLDTELLFPRFKLPSSF